MRQSFSRATASEMIVARCFSKVAVGQSPSVGRDSSWAAISPRLAQVPRADDARSVAATAGIGKATQALESVTGDDEGTAATRVAAKEAGTESQGSLVLPQRGSYNYLLANVTHQRERENDVQADEKTDHPFSVACDGYPPDRDYEGRSVSKIPAIRPLWI